MDLIPRRRSTQLGLNTLLMILFFVGIVAIFNLIISRWYFRYDLSSTRSFTLSPQTGEVLRALDRDIEILAFIQATERNYKTVHALLDGYRYINYRIDYSIYDLDSVPALAQKYGIKDYDVFVITDGKKSLKGDGINERNLTNGIIRFTRKEEKKIYFIQGYGERRITDTHRGGISQAAQGLRDTGYDVRTLNLKAVQAIPEDAPVVVIAGPRAEYSEDDLQKIRRYLQNGRVILMVDHDGERMEPILMGYGLSLSKNIVVDEKNHLAGAGPSVPLVDEYPPSDITSNFNLTSFFPTTMAISRLSGLGMWYEYTEVIRTSKGSHVEDSPGRDNGEQPVIGMMVRAKETGAILMVIGDSDFITNEYIDIAGNGNLFRNIVSYLAGETDIVSIEPVKTGFVPLYITDEEVKRITYIFGISLPLLILLSGGIIWLRRRRL